MPIRDPYHSKIISFMLKSRQSFNSTLCTNFTISIQKPINYLRGFFSLKKVTVVKSTNNQIAHFRLVSVKIILCVKTKVRAKAKRITWRMTRPLTAKMMVKYQ